jgi:hypothetical protein
VAVPSNTIKNFWSLQKLGNFFTRVRCVEYDVFINALNINYEVNIDKIYY